MNFAKFHETQI